MKVKDLKPPKHNPRKISEKKLSMLGKAMREFGNLSGIIFNRQTGNLVGGHQRLKHLRPEWTIEKKDFQDDLGTVAQGFLKTPFGDWIYREVDWDPKREKAAMIAANRHGGEFDVPMLDEILADLDDVDAELLGFSEEDLWRGDILKLKWTDVDLDRGILFFNEEKKRSKQKIKILNSDMISLLKSVPRGESEFIFNGPDGQPLKDVKRSFKTALRKTGISDFHFHDLRHTSASYMMMKGASLKSVQEHLGHTSLAMTQKYAHLSPEFQRAEIEKLSGIFISGLANSKKLVRSEETPQFPRELEAYATA